MANVKKKSKKMISAVQQLKKARSRMKVCVIDILLY